MSHPHHLDLGPERRAPLAPFNGYSWCLTQIGFASLMTVGHWDDYEHPWVVVLAVLLSGVVAGVPLSARWARTFVGDVAGLGWLVVLMMVGSQIQAPVRELSVLWPATSASLAMGLLAMIGGWRLAWCLTALLVVEGVLWGLSRELSGVHAIEQIGVLTPPLAGTLYRIFMRNARLREATAQREEADALEQMARLASQVEARRDYRTRLLQQVGPILERIEEQDDLTQADREECRLVEASLRDAIRGRGLATAAIVEAARAARVRGATVTLIDDRRSECDDEVSRLVLAATRETLDRATAGDTFVARLLPVGRRNAATVLLVNPEGAGVRREFTLQTATDRPERVVVLERPPVSLTA